MPIITVKPVSTPQELSQFIRFPWKIYEHDPHWVPPLILDQKNFFNPKKNSAYSYLDVQLFIAVDDTQTIVGRIAASKDQRHLDVYKDNRGFFGFFESINSQDVANALLDAACDWIRSKGLTGLRGPLNFTINDEAGLLVDGFDVDPYVMMPHNPDYYATLITHYGFKKAQDLWAWYLDLEEFEKQAKYIKRLKKYAARFPDLTVRQFDYSNMHRDVDVFYQVFKESWKDNWGAVPLSYDDCVKLAKRYRAQADTRLILIAEYEGVPCGIVIGLPDLNVPLKPMNGRIFPFGWLNYLTTKQKLDQFRLVIMGILPDYRNKGIESAFMAHFYDNAVAGGYKRGEFSWILESNDKANFLLEKMEAKRHKTYRVYDLALT